MSKRVAELLQIFQLRFRFGKRGFGNGNNTAASFPALAAQAHDAPNFIETEAKRLRFANESYLFERGVVVDAVATRQPLRLREEPAPLVKADRIGLDPR